MTGADGRRHLLDVARGYRRAIAEGRGGDVLRDMAIDVWRHDPSLDEVPSGTLSTVHEFFGSVHRCILSGAEDDALLLLDQLEQSLLALGFDA